jgi:hypothetical protein
VVDVGGDFKLSEKSLDFSGLAPSDSVCERYVALIAQ